MHLMLVFNCKKELMFFLLIMKKRKKLRLFSERNDGVGTLIGASFAPILVSKEKEGFYG